MKYWTGALVAGALAAGSVAPGQESDGPRPGARYIGAWAGFSFDSPSHWGITPGRQLVLAGVRGEWVLETFGSVALLATADVVPLAIVTHTPTYRVQNGGGGVQKIETGEAPVYGAGLAPVGMRVTMDIEPGVRWFVNAAGGGLVFTRDTPVPDSRRLNLTFETGTGIELVRRTGNAVMLGYKFHHLSNAHSGELNPGLDGHVLYMGYMRRR